MAALGFFRHDWVTLELLIYDLGQGREQRHEAVFNSRYCIMLKYVSQAMTNTELEAPRFLLLATFDFKINGDCISKDKNRFLGPKGFVLSNPSCSCGAAFGVVTTTLQDLFTLHAVPSIDY